MDYKIDKDVPIPATKQKLSPRREILREMSRGDSVQVLVKGSLELERNRWRNSANAEDCKVETRSVTSNGTQRLRIWRTS